MIRRPAPLLAVTLALGCARPPTAHDPAPPAAAASTAPATDAQRVVDEALAPIPHPAAAVVLDVTGATPRVLALGRHQGADPVTQARRPGSTVKPLTAWLAADQGVLAPREVVTCNRTFPGPEGFTCFDRHGPLDLPTAITVSCNAYFMDLGVRVGLQRVSTGLRDFGLARRTGLVGDEVDGFIATPEWVAANPALPAQRREAVVAIGHGPLEVTLLQLAVAYARLGAQLASPHPRVPDAVRAEILDGLRRVVNDPNGTGRGAAVSGIDIVGKTGTAEGTTFVEDQHGAQARPENGWFVGFAPSEQPRRVVAVVALRQGSGGKTAAPLAGRIFAGLQ